MNTLEILYLVGFIIAVVVRRYFMRKFKPSGEEIKLSSLRERVLLGMIGICMILPVVTFWVDLFVFADYETIYWIRWAGLILFFLSIYVLYRSHADLGKNWNAEVSINKEQSLVTSGMYKRIRHPMYTAHVIWGLANLLFFPNWIIGPCLIVFSLLFLPQRIRREEKLLVREFGGEYIEYKSRSYYIFPGF